MIRDALSMTIGYVAGAAIDLAPIRFLRRIRLQIKLNFILDAIVNVSDDIADAMHDGDWPAAEGLTDFYTVLCNERDALRVAIRELRSPSH